MSAREWQAATFPDRRYLRRTQQRDNRKRSEPHVEMESAYFVGLSKAVGHGAGAGEMPSTRQSWPLRSVTYL